MAIKNQPGIGVQELAKKCNVSGRTIYKDIAILIALGVPISTDGGYNLAPHLFIPNIAFTLNEAFFLRDTCYTLLETVHNNEMLERILEKLNSAIYLQNSPLYAQNKSLFATLKEYLTTGKVDKIAEQQQKEIINEITIAIADSSYIEIKHYNTVKEKKVDEIVQPISLIYQRKGWILLAKEKNSSSIKNIKTENIEEITITNLKYSGSNLMVDFSVQAY